MMTAGGSTRSSALARCLDAVDARHPHIQQHHPGERSTACRIACSPGPPLHPRCRDYAISMRKESCRLCAGAHHRRSARESTTLHCESLRRRFTPVPRRLAMSRRFHVRKAQRDVYSSSKRSAFTSARSPYMRDRRLANIRQRECAFPIALPLGNPVRTTAVTGRPLPSL